MNSILRRYKAIRRSGERGQALIIVLILLALGGLTIGTSLNYSSTVLNENRILKSEMRGVYSAGSGIDYAIWAHESGEAVPEYLSDNVNGMSVFIEETDHGIFTMYCGDLMYVGELPMHYDWITVNGTATYADGSSNYTITINWAGLPEAQRRLVELGVNLPPGYTFEEGSPADYGTNITTDDPDETGTSSGGSQWIKWTWKPGQGPFIDADNATQIQTFRMTGTADIEGDYCWVTAQSNDIGLVGEITGQRLTISSTATDEGTGRVSAEINADVLIAGGTAYIASWKIVR